MNKNKLFLLSLAVIIALMAAAAANAQWYDGGYYCTSGNCGVNAYNYNYGFNSGYYCSTSWSAPYQAEFVTDVTYRDGSFVSPGQSFLKTWRVKNSGTACWPAGTSLVWVGGDMMSAPAAVALPYSVAPGQTVDISVTLVAPSSQGSFSGQWELQAPDGTLFGVGCNGATPLWVTISTFNYGYNGIANYGYTYCSGSNCSATGSRAGKNPYCNNKIRDVKDVTIPDGTVVEPGTVFRKTWRMKNGGTCVWDENYVMVFAGGDNLGGAEFVRLNAVNIIYGDYDGKRAAHKIYPGDYVEFSVDLKAPETAGTYQSYYKLRDNMGYEFGFGSWAAEPFWVRITVSDSISKSAASTDALPEGNASAVTPAEAEAAETAAQVEEADAEELDGTDAALVDNSNKNVVEVDMIENTAVANKCGEQSIAMQLTDTGYTVLWTAVNDGTAAWDGYTLVKNDANPALTLASDSIEVPATQPGETAEVSFDIDLDSEKAGDDPLWMEFHLSSGSEDFCDFYFEAPAK